MENSLHITTPKPAAAGKDVRCLGRTWNHGYSCSLRHEIVLLRTGAFIRTTPPENSSFDANTVLFFNAGQPITSATLCPGATAPRCSASSPETLLDLSGALTLPLKERLECVCLRGCGSASPAQLIQHAFFSPGRLGRQTSLELVRRPTLQLGGGSAADRVGKPTRETCRPGCHRQGA